MGVPHTASFVAIRTHNKRQALNLLSLANCALDLSEPFISFFDLFLTKSLFTDFIPTISHMPKGGRIDLPFDRLLCAENQIVPNL